MASHTREQIRLPGGHSFRVLRWEGNLREVDILTAPGQSIRVKGEGTRWHYHPEMELTWFQSGGGTRFTGDHIAPFEAGDLVLLGENLPHHWQTRGASSGISVQWNFPEGHPFWSFPEALTLEPLFRRAGRGLRFTGAAAAEVTALLQELPRSSGAGRLGLLFRILGALNAADPAHVRTLSKQSFSLPTDTGHQQAISKAVRYLQANFREEIRLEDLLKLTGMTRPTFSRQFKKHSGKTCTQFLEHIRLQAVCRALKETKKPVIEIAFANGFNQISFFNRLFRREMKCSPMEYRKKARAAAG